MKILMLAYSGMTPLDLMGPLQVWSLWPEAQIQVVARSTAAIATDTVVQLLPTHNFDNCFETPDILFVPGGTKATFELLSDQPTLDFLRLKGERAQWITSVCTGALVLGAAGLLEGYQATTHWAAVDNLTTFGAIATEGRVVFDRNRVTGGGITAGIDFGLALVAKLADEQTAKVIQLALEYAPQPPFESGTPRQASEETVQAVLSQFAEALV
ncbi:MAG: cyclohexyl-isocyanide hydratase [Paraglaciecola psychrophila]|jgi:cyclohexyl-isocyanide hydratase